MTHQYNTVTLKNGLRIIHTLSSTDVVYCGYAINAGTRDETEEQSGMAHFCEHMMFKGTTRRRSIHILNRMESVGGDINAYTNKEETVVYSAFLKDHLPRAIDLLTDIVFNSTYPQAEIEKEVEVIIDEIQSYEDSPNELIFDDFEQLVFPNHPFGRNILGDPQQLKSFTTAKALEFTRHFYRPENCIFFVYGNVDFKLITRELEKAFDKVEYSPLITTAPPRITPSPYTASRKIIQKDTHQAHVMIGGRAYDAYDDRRFNLYLLHNMLGGPGMNSRRNVSLRGKCGLVDKIDSNMTSYTDAGTFCIYFGCDNKDGKRCCGLVQRELDKFIKEPLTEHQLNAAKKQLIGQIGVSCDNFENFALSVGKEFLHYDRCKNIEALYHRIEGLTTKQVQDTAVEIFSPDNLSTLIYQ